MHASHLMMLFLFAQFLSQEMGERRQEVESLLDSIDSLLPVSARQVSGDIKDQAEDISAQWQAMDAILKDKMAGLQQSNQRQEDFEEEYRNLMADVDNFHWMDNTTVNDNSADIATNLQAQLGSLEVSYDEKSAVASTSHWGFISLSFLGLGSVLATKKIISHAFVVLFQ